jgi:hypothetical protein
MIVRNSVHIDDTSDAAIDMAIRRWSVYIYLGVYRAHFLRNQAVIVFSIRRSSLVSSKAGVSTNIKGSFVVGWKTSTARMPDFEGCRRLPTVTAF